MDKVCLYGDSEVETQDVESVIGFEKIRLQI